MPCFNMVPNSNKCLCLLDYKVAIRDIIWLVSKYSLKSMARWNAAALYGERKSSRSLLQIPERPSITQFVPSASDSLHLSSQALYPVHFPAWPRCRTTELILLLFPFLKLSFIVNHHSAGTHYSSSILCSSFWNSVFICDNKANCDYPVSSVTFLVSIGPPPPKLTKTIVYVWQRSYNNSWIGQ